MIKNVYISYTNNEYRNIGCVSGLIKNLGFNVDFHRRNDTYKPEKLDSADAVVFLFKDSAFAEDIAKMTVGQMKECIRAINLRKPLFVFYEKKGGNIGIYAAEIKDNFILTGIQGTMNSMTDLKSLIYPDISQDEDLSLDNCFDLDKDTDDSRESLQRLLQEAFPDKTNKNFY